MPGQETGSGAAFPPGWWALGARSVRVEPPDRPADAADEFAFVVSHDLKQPLQGIRAYCELLLEDYRDRLDAEGRRRLEALVRLCDRLSGSISGLLRYYHAGQIAPSCEAVDLNVVAGEAIDTLRPTLESRRASVEIVDRLPTLRCDADLVGEVLGNLVSNGLKFNQSQSPRVEIGALSGDPPVIYVRDNGIGIAEEHHQEVFTIFRRLHSRQEYEGTGAGLSIARKIVEAHGGRIWLQSQPGRGTTFFFTLAPASSERSGKKRSKRPHWIRRARQRSSR